MNAKKIALLSCLLLGFLAPSAFASEVFRNNKWNNLFEFNIRTPSGLVFTVGSTSLKNNKLTLHGVTSSLHTITVMPDKSFHVSHNAYNSYYPTLRDFRAATGFDKRADIPLADISETYLRVDLDSSAPTAVKGLLKILSANEQRIIKSQKIENLSGTILSLRYIKGYEARVDEAGKIKFEADIYERLSDGEIGRQASITVATPFDVFGSAKPKTTLRTLKKALAEGEVFSEVYRTYSYYSRGAGTLTTHYKDRVYIIDWVKTGERYGTVTAFRKLTDGRVLSLGYFEGKDADKFIEYVDQVLPLATEITSCESFLKD